MARRRLSLAHAALAALAGCATTAYALAFGAPAAFALLPVFAASLAWKADRLGARALLWPSGLLIAAVAVVPGLLMIGSVGEGVARSFVLWSGAGLALLAAIHLFGAPARAVPASMALLVTAAFSYREASLPVLFAASGLALVVWLAADRKPRLLPLLGLVSTAAAVAAGVGLALPVAQPWVEAKIADLGSGATARAGLSLASRLGDVERLGLSPAVAARVWADAPRYLRARVFKSYAGRAWTGSLPRKRMGPGAGLDGVPGTTYAAPGEGPGAYRARILQEATVRDALPAPSGVRLARLGGEPPWIDAAGVLTPIGPPPALYAVACGPGGDAGAPEDFLDVPDGLDPRLRALAAGFEGTPEERIRRTLEELERRCVYALDVGAFQSADPVGEFVFDKRRGYCEYFASAAALLLRMQKVPARYVVGYSVRPSNYEGGHYVVREGDAHAWVEAWLPGRGWVEVDPTPGAQFEAMRERIRGTGVWEGIKAWFSETLALFREGARARAFLRVGGLVAGVALLGAAIRLLRRRKRRTSIVPPERPPLPAGPRELLKALDVAWAKAGHPRPPSRAPLEHLAKMPTPVGEAAVRAVYRCVYGGGSMTDVELAELRKSFASEIA
ncbi:MAG TPA: transglutaminaseTgpA domain-containing protein [Planctomycetota bacterium]